MKKIIIICLLFIISCNEKKSYKYSYSFQEYKDYITKQVAIYEKDSVVFHFLREDVYVMSNQNYKIVFISKNNTLYVKDEINKPEKLRKHIKSICKNFEQYGLVGFGRKMGNTEIKPILFKLSFIKKETLLYNKYEKCDTTEGRYEMGIITFISKKDINNRMAKFIIGESLKISESEYFHTYCFY